MTGISRFEDLKAWQDARKLTNLIYQITDEQKFSRDFALRDQIRRASISTMSNIAEGFESRTNRMFIDYLGRARASAGEVRSQLYVARDRDYIDDKTFAECKDLSEEISRQIRGFSDYLHTASEQFSVRESPAEYAPD